jgi:peroxidase
MIHIREITMFRTGKHFQPAMMILIALLSIGFCEIAQAQNLSPERAERIEDYFGEKKGLRRVDPELGRGAPPWFFQFRTIDGTYNNLVALNWGMAGANLFRRLPSDYSDGVSAPAGANRKSARSISNLMCWQNNPMPNARGMSSMVWQWGQFLDHDISITEAADPLEAFPILVPTPDPYFDPFNLGGQQIMLFRSEYRLNQPPSQPREQVNGITSWIDGSNVYGSDFLTAWRLRTFEGGHLKMSEGDLLPIDEEGFFMAGDVRVNEQVCLTAMHTLFAREHNRIADRIAEFFPLLNDEQLYQWSRRRVIGIMQAITYNEFLPAIMGENALAPYQGYNPMWYPNITNTFANAGYRFGHSMLPPDIYRMDNSGEVIPAGNLELKEAFFNPDHIKDYGIDPYIKGLMLQRAQEIDTKVIDDVRNFLFGEPGEGGFDLAALNIQRGRDHGIPDFNTIRESFGLPAYESFDQISSNFGVQFGLSQAYDSVHDIDAWVGFLSEDHKPGANVGETLFLLMKQQFESLRKADRFWYERDFSGFDREVIHNTKLMHVIIRNCGVIPNQPEAFFIPADE